MDAQRKGLATKLAVGFGTAAVVFGALTALGHRKETPDSVEAMAMKEPAFARYIPAFRESFPSEYRRFLQGTADDANARVPAAQAQANGFQRVNALVLSHRADLARAPDAALLTHVRAEAAVLEALGPEQCARFFTTGPRPDEKIEGGALDRVADFTAATMRAERAGMDHPTERPAGLDPADARALYGAMQARGLSAAQLDAFRGGTVASLAPADQCAVGRGMTGAMGSLPGAQAGRLWSYSLKLS